MVDYKVPETQDLCSDCIDAAIFDVVSDGIWDWNANTNYVYRNPGWYRMLGYEPHSFENTVVTWEKVIHEDDYARVMKTFDACIHKEIGKYQVEYRCRTHSGDYIWIEDTAKVVKWNDDGSVARMVGAHRNIHAQKLLQEQLATEKKSMKQVQSERNEELAFVNRELQKKIEEVEKLAVTDALTGVANRRRFEEFAQQEIERSHRFNEPTSIIILDVDNFKQINDRLGHTGGDSVLIQITREIRRHIRSIDLLARWGGDELVILLPHTSLDDAVGVAEKIRAAVEVFCIAEDVKITLSLGVATFMSGDTLTELVKRADKALYVSKASGRNCVHF